MNNKESLCEIVQDILPLYVDDICSPSSREMVQNHIAECEDCKAKLKCLKETELTMVVEKERNNILQHHAKREKTAAWKAGIIISVLLFIPVMLAVIFAAAGYVDIGTVLVLTSAMILTAAFIVIPLLSKEKKFVKMILVSTGAIILIELFMSIFFHGGSFVQIAVSTVFGISVVFFPFVVKGVEWPELLASRKGFIVMIWDTIWLYLTVLAITLVERDYEGCKTGMVVSTIFIVFGWIVYFIIKRKTLNNWMKASLISVILGFLVVFGNDIIDLALTGKKHLQIMDINLADWVSESSASANINFLVFVGMMLTGIILRIIARRRMKKNVE